MAEGSLKQLTGSMLTSSLSILGVAHFVVGRIDQDLVKDLVEPRHVLDVLEHQLLPVMHPQLLLLLLSATCKSVIMLHVTLCGWPVCMLWPCREDSALRRSFVAAAIGLGVVRHTYVCVRPQQDVLELRFLLIDVFDGLLGLIVGRRGLQNLRALGWGLALALQKIPHLII